MSLSYNRFLALLLILVSRLFIIEIMPKRRYASYDERTILNAKRDIEAGKTLRKTAAKYGMNRQTLKNKCSNLHSSKYGRPQELTAEEEKKLAERIQLLGDWGFPVVALDIRMFVKKYLERLGTQSKRWKDNLPGTKWVNSFCKRNNLTSRMVTNISRKRAAVSETCINAYFDELETTLSGIPPENIINVDESGLTDDPRKKKCVVRKGCRYPEMVRNATKVTTSVMFSGSADGTILPPYVVYKAKNVYEQWTEGGPKEARYTYSSSGWFDEDSFQDWFFSICLPHLRRKEGQKAIIGDNLSSHLSERVINSCKEQNIHFICLPPNSTHLTQPLDVAFFAPLKKQWRSIISAWKQTNVGRKYNTLPKDCFPAKLKKLMDDLKTENMIAGFKACGLVPLNREEVLKKLPQKPPSADESITAIDSTIIEHLESLRGSKDVPGPSKRRRKKLNVVPGRSGGGTETETDVNEDEEDTDCPYDSDTHSEEQEESGTEDFRVEEMVIVSYEGSNFPGRIKEIKRNGIVVDAMQKCSSTGWRWPEVTDTLFYSFEDVVENLPSDSVIPYNDRGVYVVKSTNLSMWSD